MRTIVLTLQATRELNALPQPARQAIMSALSEYSVHGRGDIKKLIGRPGYRLRVGSYRVVFTEDKTTIPAIYVDRRTSKTYSR